MPCSLSFLQIYSDRQCPHGELLSTNSHQRSTNQNSSELQCHTTTIPIINKLEITSVGKFVRKFVGKLESLYSASRRLNDVVPVENSLAVPQEVKQTFLMIQEFYYILKYLKNIQDKTITPTPGILMLCSGFCIHTHACGTYTDGQTHICAPNTTTTTNNILNNKTI